MSARRYLVVIQAPGGYPPRGAPLEDAPLPPDPMVHTVVMEVDYERHVGHLLARIHGNEHTGEAAGCEKCAAVMKDADA